MDFISLLFSFSGRLNRKPYWIFNIILFLIIFVVELATGTNLESDELSIPLLITGLILVWPALAIQAKRWHDTNRSAWWILSGFIPIFGTFWVLFACGLSKGTEGENDYGPDPLA